MGKEALRSTVVSLFVPLVAVVALMAVAALPVPMAGTASAATDEVGCAPETMPFTGVPGADLRPERHTSRDAEPVAYLRWRGTVPSFDGMPMSVDVTVPCGTTEPLPTVVMAHGFTDDKTVWEETGKSDTVLSEDRPGSNSRWNNIWFASRGYAVLNYTARGWHDSCGRGTPGWDGDQPPPQCTPFEYWIHLDDVRWEVRDLQWLTGALVQGGTADPQRLAVTGGSYGGAPTLAAALLDGNVTCGAADQPAELGDDPCAGRGDGDLAPWTTPDGAVPLRWAAAVPMYTFGHLLDVLAPNGRGSDGWSGAPADGDRTQPFGVPLESTVSGLILVARTFGVLAPPGADPSSDIAASTDRMLAGNPFPPDEPAVRDGIEEYRRFKSPLSIEPQGRVPIFWVQGLTDALFPASQAVWGAQELRAADPDYPVKLFLGDLGHDYAAERTDEWDVAKDQMNAFVDHHLRPDRTPDVPEFDVTAAITRCLDPDAPADLRTAPTWHDLHPQARTFTGDSGGTTSTATAGPTGAAADPISTATLPGPDSYKGCRVMEPSGPDPTAVTYEFTLEDDLVTIGAPVVSIGFGATGTDTPMAVRVWDVAPDRSRQGLVTRGVHRVADAGADQVATFQLAPQGYRFPAGHHLKVEVTANDSPYLQASNVHSEVNVTSLEITLPEAADPSATPSPTIDAEAGGEGSSDPVWPLYLGGVALIGGAAVAAAWLSRRHRR